ncbi:MAG: hypothetical protein ACRD3E_18115, partial [Terriglobales bacterium]
MRRFLLAVVLICLAAPCVGQDKPAVNLEQILSQHVASIGKPEALAAVAGRGVEAAAHFTIVQGGSGEGEGTVKFGSADTKTRFNLRVHLSGYNGEDFTCDGNKVQVSRLVSGSTALLGVFFYDKQFLLKEGVFGGVLSTAWPMLHSKTASAKLKYSGMKKIDGRELHEVRYEPKDFYPGLEVRMYFEPDTFHHVMTIYEWHVRSDMTADAIGGRSRTVSNDTDQAIEVLRESFSDFRMADGVVLPARWTID